MHRTIYKELPETRCYEIGKMNSMSPGEKRKKKKDYSYVDVLPECINFRDYVTVSPSSCDLELHSLGRNTFSISVLSVG